MDWALAQLIYAMPVIKTFHLRHTNGLACFVAWCLSQGTGGGGGGHEIPWQHFRVPEASVKGLGVFSTLLYLSRAGSELCHTVCAHCERGPACSMLEIVHILLTLGEEARREGGRELESRYLKEKMQRWAFPPEGC